MLEEGEPVYKDYVYSDNIKASKKFLEANTIPAKYEGKLYSEIADSFFEEAEDRPYDPISRNGLEAMLGRLAEAQEQQKQDSDRRKLERELKNLSPEELDALEQELMAATQPQPEEMAAQPEVAAPMPEEQIPVEEPVEMPEESMPEQQVMAEGGKMNKYYPGGDIDINPWRVLDLDKAAHNDVQHALFDWQPTSPAGVRRVHYLRDNVPAEQYELNNESAAPSFDDNPMVSPYNWMYNKWMTEPYFNGVSRNYLYNVSAQQKPASNSTTSSSTNQTTATQNVKPAAPAVNRDVLTGVKPVSGLNTKAYPGLAAALAQAEADNEKAINAGINRINNPLEPLPKGPEIKPGKATVLNNESNIAPWKRESVTTPVENEEKPSFSALPTFARYAGAIGSGILGLYNAAQSPDRYTATRIRPYVPTGHINLQNERYMPVDQNMIQNQMLAQGNSTQRALRNSGLGPSSAAAILAADNNTTGNLGTGFLQSWQANNQQRNAVTAANNQAEAQRAQFDYAVDAAKQRALAEAQYRNAYNDLMLQRYNYQAEADKYNAVSNQINAGLEALSGIGRENFIRNQINSNTALNGYRTLGNGIGAYMPYNCGGFLKKYKK